MNEPTCLFRIIQLLVLAGAALNGFVQQQKARLQHDTSQASMTQDLDNSTTSEISLQQVPTLL